MATGTFSVESYLFKTHTGAKRIKEEMGIQSGCSDNTYNLRLGVENSRPACATYRDPGSKISRKKRECRGRGEEGVKRKGKYFLFFKLKKERMAILSLALL